MEPGLMRVPEAAVFLGVARSTAYQLVAQGAIPTVRVGRSVRVPREALLRWIDRQTVPPASASSDVPEATLRQRAASSK